VILDIKFEEGLEAIIVTHDLRFYEEVSKHFIASQLFLFSSYFHDP
jgi:ABC-type polar amino acid transport system ATPase subunit